MKFKRSDIADLIGEIKEWKSCNRNHAGYLFIDLSDGTAWAELFIDRESSKRFYRKSIHNITAYMAAHFMNPYKIDEVTDFVNSLPDNWDEFAGV